MKPGAVQANQTSPFVEQRLLAFALGQPGSDRPGSPRSSRTGWRSAWTLRGVVKIRRAAGDRKTAIDPIPGPTRVGSLQSRSSEPRPNPYALRTQVSVQPDLTRRWRQ